MNDRELLLRYIEGSLVDDERRRLEQRMTVETSLRDEFVLLRSIGETVVSVRPDGFGAFFAERTLRALHPKTGDIGLPLYEALRWVFVRTAVAGLALVILLSILNVLDYQGLDLASSWLEAAFGLPSTTVEDAFSYGFI